MSLHTRYVVGHVISSLFILFLLVRVEHPRFWHKPNGGGLHSGLAALASRSERSKTVHRVGMKNGVVQMVPVHRRSQFSQRRSFCIVLCDSVDAKTSFVVPCVS